MERQDSWNPNVRVRQGGLAVWGQDFILAPAF